MRYLVAAALLVSGCGVGEKFEADANKVSEDVQNAIEQSPEQKAFIESHPDAQSAVGAWTYDADAMVLTLNIETSDFSCEIESGGTFQMQLGALTDSTMTTLVGDNGEAQIWERTGSGAGIQGNWSSAEGAQSFLLTLSADGSFILSIDGMSCGSGDDGGTDHGYTEGGCFYDWLPQVAIVVDGEVDDWDSVSPVNDPADDSSGSATGDEMVALYVAGNDTQLAWRLSFAEDISTGVQPSGDYKFGYETANKLGSFRVRYEQGNQQFAVYDGNNVVVAVNGTEMEVRANWSDMGGKAELIRTEVTVNSDTPGGAPLDEGLCFGEVPR